MILRYRQSSRQSHLDQRLHFTRLAAAAAVAKSDLPLMLLCCIPTLVRLGFEADADMAAACDARLACTPTPGALMFDCLLGADLLGEMALASCLAVLTLKVEDGGTGRGLAPLGALTEFIRLIGELTLL